MSVEVLIGNIASGKSTYSIRRAREGAIIINDDSIVQALHAGEYRLYDKKLKRLYKSIEMNILMQSIVCEKDVVIDRGLNVTVASRQKFISLARSFDTPCDAVVFKFNTPEEHAEKRFMSHNRGLPYTHWLKAATRMNEEYEPPTQLEGFRNIQYEGQYQEYLQPGDGVVFIKECGKKYNNYITHKIGTYATIEEVGPDYYVVTTQDGGYGAIDQDIVRKLKP